MKKIWIIALISALLMFICGYSFLSTQAEKSSGAASDQRIVDVVIAAQDIPPYTTLTSDMFITKQTVANAFLTGYFSSISDVVGSISTTTIFSGEVLTGSRITKEQNAVGLSAQLEDGMRAITIDVDATQGVANNIKVGNYVDVVFVAELGSEEINGQKVTAGMGLTALYGAGQPANTQVVGENIGQHFSAIALQKVRVVALDSSTGDVATDAAPAYSNVTVEVSPADAARIALLNNNGGKIQLLLRPMEDESTVDENRNTVLKNTQ